MVLLFTDGDIKTNGNNNAADSLNRIKVLYETYNVSLDFHNFGFGPSKI